MENEAGSLIQITPEEYILQEGQGVWIGIGSLDVRITTFTQPGQEGVGVKIFPRHHADLDWLGSCSAYLSDAIAEGGVPQNKASVLDTQEGFLIKGPEAPEDYDLRDNVDSIWIGYKEIDIHIKRQDEGVVVDLWPHVDEYDDSLDTTWVLFAEGEFDEEEEDFPEEKLFAEGIIAIQKQIVEDSQRYKPGYYPDSLYAACADEKSEIKVNRVWLLPREKSYKGISPEICGPKIIEWYKKQPFYMSSFVALVLCEEGTNNPRLLDNPEPMVTMTGMLPDGRTPLCLSLTPFISTEGDVCGGLNTQSVEVADNNIPVEETTPTVIFDKFALGDRVKVISVDETLDPEKYVGKIGVVFKIQGSGLGVGESEKNPGIWVSFKRSSLDTFLWSEELEKVGEASEAELFQAGLSALVKKEKINESEG